MIGLLELGAVGWVSSRSCVLFGLPGLVPLHPLVVLATVTLRLCRHRHGHHSLGSVRQVCSWLVVADGHKHCNWQSELHELPAQTVSSQLASLVLALARLTETMVLRMGLVCLSWCKHCSPTQRDKTSLNLQVTGNGALVSMSHNIMPAQEWHQAPTAWALCTPMPNSSRWCWATEKKRPKNFQRPCPFTLFFRYFLSDTSSSSHKFFCEAPKKAPLPVFIVAHKWPTSLKNGQLYSERNKKAWFSIAGGSGPCLRESTTAAYQNSLIVVISSGFQTKNNAVPHHPNSRAALHSGSALHSGNTQSCRLRGSVHLRVSGQAPKIGQLEEESNVQKARAFVCMPV